VDHEFRKEIISLIERRQEGSYWDYKSEHHQNPQDLLHDVICMSNNLENRDAYIIFGVKDGSGRVIGIDENDVTHNLSYFRQHLKDKDFAGGVRPDIDFETIEIGNRRVDVLTIKNSYHAPFYLNTDYRDVKKYHIYTRINDTNTDKSSSADPNHVELLWRKRFRLDSPKIEQLKMLLKRLEDWEDYGPRFVHKILPEFNIALGEISLLTLEAFEYFYAYCNGEGGKLVVNYLTSPIYETDWISFDNSSLSICAPRKDRVWVNGTYVWYYYYSKDSLTWLLTNFLMHGEVERLNDCGSSPFIIFENTDEKKEFERYLWMHPELSNLDFDHEITAVLKREQDYGPGDNVIDVGPAWKIRRIFDYWKDVTLKIPNFSKRFRDIEKSREYMKSRSKKHGDK